jgi:hypothetical protein
MGTTFRKVVGPLFAGFVLVIIAGIAPWSFFDELERENAWYNNPAFVAVFRQFVTHTWFLCVASGLGGLILGLCLNRIFRPRQLIETAPPTDTKTAPSPDAPANTSAQNSKRELAKTLDDLYAEGVQLRNQLQNRLLSPKIGDILEARDRFRGWHKEVLLALDNDHISNRRRFRFRTLDLFNPNTISGSSKLEQQEALWNEKLDRLRQIIDLLGVMGTEAANTERSAAASDGAQSFLRRSWQL